MEYLTYVLTSPLSWLIWAVVVFLATFFMDALDHGLFFGVPAFLMPLFCYWVTPEVLLLLIYAIITAIFYKFCGRFRDWFHGSPFDINDD